MNVRSTNVFAASIIVAGCAGGAVAVAIAADLPNRKAAPAPAEDGLATCNVGGMLGFAVPGSDTCLRIGGFVSGELSEGTLTKQYGLEFTGTPGSTPVTLAEITPISLRDSFGMSGHVQLDLDARSNTAYGPLRAYMEVLTTTSAGFESSTNGTYLNVGYIQFAGLTAGKIGSFFSYIAGGPAWYDFYSPDRFNGNQPTLIAYTANFDAVSATLSLEEPTGARVNGPIDGGFANLYYGVQYPDIVGQLRTEMNWGSAQVSAVAHNTHVEGFSAEVTNRWGGAVLAGLTYNLPEVAPGDKVAGQVVLSRGALGYSGLSNTAWSPYDQGLNINGNGTIYQLIDALNYDTGQWSIPSTWSIAAFFEHHFTPEISVTPQAAYGVVNYSGSPGMISTHASSVMIGGTSHYLPVPNLDFQLGLMYQVTNQSTPTNYVGPEPFHARASGLAATFQVVRAF